jgi:transcription elongation factor GreA
MGEAEESEYQIALEEQAFIEGRIQELESILANYQVIEPGQSNGLIHIGSTVMIRENGMDAETYTIVGTAEANPETGLISNESPLGNALLGSSVGDDIEVNAPAGLLKFRVLAVQ